MKAIFKLFILNFLALALLPSCSDDDQSNSEQNDPISGNISPVGSFSVEATNNENELLVKWTNPSNRDVDMVELSYRDVEASLSRATDFSPGHIIIQVERDVTQEYLLKVPYFATYEVSAVAISKAGKRSVPESRIMMPYHEKVDEPELKLPEMLDRAHSYMTSVIGYYFGKSSRSCWRGNYPYDGKGYWDGDALVWGQGGGLSAFVAMRDATKESEVENIYGAMDDMMFKGIQYFCQLDRGILAYYCYPAAGNERFYDDNVWIGLDMVDWYTETKEMRYLTQAKVVWRYLIDHGWDETCGGGVHWRELNEHTTSKHSCSTGPTAVMGCRCIWQLRNRNISTGRSNVTTICWMYCKTSPTIYSMTMYARIRMIPICRVILKRTSILTIPDSRCRQPVFYIRLPANRNIWMKRMRLLKAVIRNGLCPIVPKN